MGRLFLLAIATIPICASPVLSAVELVTGIVEAVDDDAATITVTDVKTNKSRTVDVASGAKITVDGQLQPLSALTIGSRVSLTIDPEKQTVQKISALTNRPGQGRKAEAGKVRTELAQGGNRVLPEQNLDAKDGKTPRLDKRTLCQTCSDRGAVLCNAKGCRKGKARASVSSEVRNPLTGSATATTSRLVSCSECLGLGWIRCEKCPERKVEIAEDKLRRHNEALAKLQDTAFLASAGGKKALDEGLKGLNLLYDWYLPMQIAGKKNREQAIDALSTDVLSPTQFTMAETIASGVPELIWGQLSLAKPSPANSETIRDIWEFYKSASPSRKKK